MLGLKKAEYLGTNRRCFFEGGVAVVDTVYQQPVFEGWHSHENAHITLVVEGGNREHRRGGDIDTRPGQVLFYHSGELHRNSHTSFPSKNVNVEIEGAFLQHFGLTEATLAQALRHRVGAAQAVLQLYKEALMRDAFTADSIRMVLVDLATVARRAERGTPAWVTTVTDYLQDCWNGTPTLHELAAVAGVGPVTVSKFFPKYVGCTLGEYMRRLKIERSLALVKQPDANLTDVAYACGFADQSHFTRVFKSQTGFLPKTYRTV